ncbi:MAG: FAD-binding oxidoreductase [Vicinamibacteraceae bacterium]
MSSRSSTAKAVRPAPTARPRETAYGTSYWLDRVGRRPAPAQRLTSDLETDVVIVGGGLTGCLTACLFARAGVPVVVLEAERVGDRASLDAGWLLETPGVDFLHLQAALGLKEARRAYEATRRAALDVAAFLRRLGPKLAPEPRESLVIAATPADAAVLERERAGRTTAGLDAVWLPARRAASESGADLVRGALKTRSEGLIDPWQTSRALVDAATSAGARLFEQSPATKVRHTRIGVEVVTAKGVVRAKAVVLATGAPRPLVAALQRHVRVDHTYVVVTEELPAAMRRALPAEAIVRSAGVPLVAALTNGGRVVIQGGDQPPVPARLADQTLVQRTGQLMYEWSLRHPAVSGIQPAYAWTAVRVAGRDGLLIAGAHRNFPHHLFALGLGATGLAGAWLAARIVLRQYQGEPEPGDAIFGFGRLAG